MSWKAIVEEVIADRRRAMGERPSLDELIELREGRLSADARERVLERAAVDPEVAGELLDVLDYPALPPADGEPDAERKAERWRRFKERLRAAGEGESAPGEVVPWPRAVDRRQVVTTSPLMKMAATFLVGTLAGTLGMLALRQRPQEPAAPARNVETVGLSLDSEPGSRGGRVRLPETAEWVLLTFGSGRLPPASDYGILVRDTAGVEVWRHDGLEPGTGGLLTVLVPVRVLPPGGYLAEIYPDDDFEDEPAATATWTVESVVP
jgi:hypothetical protein